MERRLGWILAAIGVLTLAGAAAYRFLSLGPGAGPQVVGKWEGECKPGTPATTPPIHVDRRCEFVLRLSGRFNAVLIHFTRPGAAAPKEAGRRTIEVPDEMLTEAANTPQTFRRDMDVGDYEFEFQGRGAWRLEVRR